jgi:hypothetical protein
MPGGVPAACPSARSSVVSQGHSGPGRAQGFADVYDLAKRYGRGALLEWAAASDTGFDQQVFAEMLATLDQLTNEDSPVDARQAPLLRTFFRQWASELTWQ